MSTPKSQMTAKDIRAFFKEIKLFNDLKLRGFQISVTQGRGTAHSWVSITLTSSKKHEQYVESIIRDLIEKLLRTKFQKNIASYYTDYGINDDFAPCISICFRTE